MKKKINVLQEFWVFLREEKLRWILPIVLFLAALVALLLLFGGGPEVAPYIYTVD